MNINPKLPQFPVVVEFCQVADNPIGETCLRPIFWGSHVFHSHFHLGTSALFVSAGTSLLITANVIFSLSTQTSGTMSKSFENTGAQPKIGEQPDQTLHSQMNLRDSATDSQTAKSKTDVYTTAPWAKRTELSQLAAPSETTSSDPAAGESNLSTLFVSLTRQVLIQFHLCRRLR